MYKFRIVNNIWVTTAIAAHTEAIRTLALSARTVVALAASHLYSAIGG